MHSVMITFTSSVGLNELEDLFNAYADELVRQPGMLAKAWIQDGSTLGGFHLFADEASVDAYLGSELAAGLMANGWFSNFEVRKFDVLADFSARTGTPELPALTG